MINQIMRQPMMFKLRMSGVLAVILLSVFTVIPHAVLQSFLLNTLLWTIVVDMIIHLLSCCGETALVLELNGEDKDIFVSISKEKLSLPRHKTHGYDMGLQVVAYSLSFLVLAGAGYPLTGFFWSVFITFNTVLRFLRLYVEREKNSNNGVL